jgi:hypothetical protein
MGHAHEFVRAEATELLKNVKPSTKIVRPALVGIDGRPMKEIPQ